MLRSLVLRDYRNLGHATLDLSPRFNLLVGQNGAGKTNILEAVYFLATLRSFRTSEQAALLRHEASHGSVEASVDDEVAGVPTTLQVRLERRDSGVRKSALADGKTVRRGADFYGRLRAILFTPEDLAVLRGGPSARRQLLDRVVFAVDRAHLSDVTAYEKAVRSRNRVLRDELGPTQRGDLLDTYDEQIATIGGRIWQRRVEALAAVHARFLENFAEIHGRNATGDLAYAPKLDCDAATAHERAQVLARALEERRTLDLARKTTTVGPHRDDLRVTLDGVVAGNYASQGQTRALMLAFKLAELQAAREMSGIAPILLLDDVSSELDPVRSEKLFAALEQEASQCILTTTESRFAPLQQSAFARHFHVAAGTVEPAEAERPK